MNKKQLYESIMSSVAKEVKKTLLENQIMDERENFHQNIERKAIHFDELPSEYKSIENDEAYILFNKMTKEEVENFIKNIDWKPIKDYIDSTNVGKKFNEKRNTLYSEYYVDSEYIYNGNPTE